MFVSIVRTEYQAEEDLLAESESEPESRPGKDLLDWKPTPQADEILLAGSGLSD